MADSGISQMTIWRTRASHVVYLKLQTHTHRIWNTYCFPTAKCWTKAPQFYVTRTLPVLYIFKYQLPKTHSDLMFVW